jgi:hypothetical protein
MDYQRRPCHGGEKCPSGIEVQTPADYNEQEKKKANNQRDLPNLLAHDIPPSGSDTGQTVVTTRA